jgi:hypothetical protein
MGNNMAKRTKTKTARTQIFSIFGQIEAAAADVLIERGQAERIQWDEIPQSVRFNDAGRRAYFAVVVPGKHMREFDKLCKGLRS